MNVEPALALRPPIAKKLGRPPAFEIPATPDADLPEPGKFESAVDPAAASPAGRPQVPVWMVVERQKDKGIRDLPGPKRTQMMKIAGTIKYERGDSRFVFAVKFLD